MRIQNLHEEAKKLIQQRSVLWETKKSLKLQKMVLVHPLVVNLVERIGKTSCVQQRNMQTIPLGIKMLIRTRVEQDRKILE